LKGGLATFGKKELSAGKEPGRPKVDRKENGNSKKGAAWRRAASKRGFEMQAPRVGEKTPVPNSHTVSRNRLGNGSNSREEKKGIRPEGGV